MFTSMLPDIERRTLYLLTLSAVTVALLTAASLSGTSTSTATAAAIALIAAATATFFEPIGLPGRRIRIPTTPIVVAVAAAAGGPLVAAVAALGEGINRNNTRLVGEAPDQEYVWLTINQLATAGVTSGVTYTTANSWLPDTLTYHADAILAAAAAITIYLLTSGTIAVGYTHLARMTDTTTRIIQETKQGLPGAAVAAVAAAVLLSLGSTPPVVSVTLVTTVAVAATTLHRQLAIEHTKFDALVYNTAVLSNTINRRNDGRIGRAVYLAENTADMLEWSPSRKLAATTTLWLSHIGALAWAHPSAQPTSEQQQQLTQTLSLELLRDVDLLEEARSGLAEQWPDRPTAQLVQLALWYVQTIEDGRGHTETVLRIAEQFPQTPTVEAFRIQALQVSADLIPPLWWQHARRGRDHDSSTP